MNDTIGIRIAQCRKALGLSQEALGEKMGVSRQAVNKWESDAAIPEIDKLIGLSKLFGVPIGWLLGVEDTPREQDSQQVSLEELEAILKQSSPRPSRWQKPLIIATACCAVFSLILSIGTFWQTHINSDMFYSLSTTCTRRYSDLSDRIFYLEDAPPQQAVLGSQLLESAEFMIRPTEDWSAARVNFFGLPMTYTEGETARLVIYQDGVKLKDLLCLYDAPKWWCTMKLPVDDGYSFVFVLTKEDGTTVQETVSSIEASDIEAQMRFSCTSSCSAYSYSGGHLRLVDYRLWMNLPPVLWDMEDLQWESLDLVLYRNGEEAARESLEVSSNNRLEGEWWWSELPLPLESTEDGDQLELRVEGTVSGYSLSCTDQIWEIQNGDPILTYVNSLPEE